MDKLGRDMTNEEWHEKYGTDPYAKDAKIKDAYREMNQGKDARLKMDANPLETTEQEKNRLSRQLNATIQENEITIHVLKQLMDKIVIKQKRMYFLRGSIIENNLNELREILK